MMDHDAEKELIKEFNLSQQQAKFCILVASGKKPIDAVLEVYSYTNKPNAYGQLKTLMSNRKIDAAMKSLGLTLQDRFEKNAYAVIQAFEEIAFSKSVSTRDRLTALRELAAYNPLLQTMRKKDAEDTDEQDLAKRVEEFIEEQEPGTRPEHKS